MDTKQELKQLRLENEKLSREVAIEKEVNARMAKLETKSAIQTRASKKKVARSVAIGDIYNNEKVVGFAKVGQVRPTPNQKGKMVHFNKVEGKGQNFLGFVSNGLLALLKANKKYPITERVAKSSGKKGYACYHYANKAVYATKK